MGHKLGEACCPGAGSVGSVARLVEAEANQVTIGGGGLVWNIGAVELVEAEAALSTRTCCPGRYSHTGLTFSHGPETDQSGEWQVQKGEKKKQKRAERAAVMKAVEKIEAQKKDENKKIEMMKAVVGDEGEVKRICIGAVAEVATIEMNFQVCEVKKALAAVRRICKAGNVVQFGSEP